MLVLAILAIAALILPPHWYTRFPAAAPELPPMGLRVAVSPSLSVNVIEVGAGPVLSWVTSVPPVARRFRAKMSGLAVGEEIHARAPNSEWRVIPQAGHVLPITHAPLLADAIATFAAGGTR